MAENYLIHHGVKGMKWGVRRKLPTVSTPNQEKTGSRFIPDKQTNPFSKGPKGSVPSTQRNPFEKPITKKEIKAQKKDVEETKTILGINKNVSEKQRQKTIEKVAKREAKNDSNLNETDNGKKPEKKQLTPEQKAQKLNTAAKLTQIGTQAVSEASNAYDSHLRNKSKEKAIEETKTMSDSELRSKVNRMQLEQQYANLNPATVSKGQRAISGIFTAITAIGSLAVTGLTAATLIQQLKNNKK